jgi:hypothetical protein
MGDEEMNIELLRKAQEFILNNPDKLNMSVFYTPYQECGCIVGHSYKIQSPDFNYNDVDFWKFAEDVLDLTDFQTDYLVRPSGWWPGKAKTAYFYADYILDEKGKALAVAAYIDEFIDHFSKPENNQ